MHDAPLNIAGIILAAGISSRLGQPKLLLRLRDKPLLAWVIEAARNSLLTKTVLVLGHNAAQIQKILNYPDIAIVYNPDYEKGQSHSIRHGMKALDPSTDAVIFLLGDQPMVRPETINALITAYAENRSLIIVPTFRGRRGNPVLFDRRLFQKLKKISGDSGGRVLFGEYPDSILDVAVKDKGIHMDVDTQADYQKLLEYHGK
jgi:molybdenum cofactor cytidylyltransferase